MKRYIFIPILSIIFPFVTVAQICTGSLGDNIFIEGDFGSGASNVLSPNPNIAPGYDYIFSGPPFDGEYLITNNTGWSQLFSTWLSISDNSSDPNGYMMVVNATIEPGLFYEQSISGLCENTLYEFSADIINMIRVGIQDHIPPNVSFLLDGVSFFETGDIPETNDWTNYGFTFTTSAGQESLTLALQNNAPGGIGNDLALDNITFRACGPDIFITPETSMLDLCEDVPPVTFEATLFGGSYVDPKFQWQVSFDEGMTWQDISGENNTTFTASPILEGLQYYRFLVADGDANILSEKCRVASNPKIINGRFQNVTQSDTICLGTSLTVGTSTYTETGIFTDVFVNIFGCDSTVITDLVVIEDNAFNAEFSVVAPCPNQSNGSILTTNIISGSPPFNFTFEGIDFGTGSNFLDLAGGFDYSIVIEDGVGCTVEETVFVANPSDLILDLGADQVIELGETVKVAPFYNFTPNDFEWQSSLLMDCVDFEVCDEFDLTPTTSEVVVLDLFAGNGCIVRDSFSIQVLDIRKVWIPNIFSPNDDGKNDIFTVYGDQPNVQLIEELQIFDRWGSLVFERKNFLPNTLENGWDGSFNGEVAPRGVYVFSASVRFIDDEVVRYGGDVAVVW